MPEAAKSESTRRVELARWRAAEEGLRREEKRQREQEAREAQAVAHVPERARDAIRRIRDAMYQIQVGLHERVFTKNGNLRRRPPSPQDIEESLTRLKYLHLVESCPDQGKFLSMEREYRKAFEATESQTEEQVLERQNRLLKQVQEQQARVKRAQADE